MYLHPPWHLQVHLQNWHYLVPIWWTNLWYEVWKLDLRWIQGILQYYIFYTKLFAKCTISQQTNYSYFINFQLDLILKAQQGDLGTYVDNGEWHLIGELISYLTFYLLQYLLLYIKMCLLRGIPRRMTAVRSPTLTSPSRSTSGGGPCTTSSTWSSRVSWLLPWRCSASLSPQTPERSFLLVRLQIIWRGE